MDTERQDDSDMQRRGMALGGITVVVAASIGGFVAGSRITSPAEIATRTAPPTPSLIQVPAEERVLSTNVVTRGTGRFGSPQKLTIAPSSLKPNVGIVSQAPLVGAELAEGAVALRASGRPVFVLTGGRPMSRDLGPGSSGDDVSQLEASLARLGFDPGAVDGVFDESTSLAVTNWYAAAGYSAFGATPDQQAAVRARETDVGTTALEAVAAADARSAAEAALAGAQAASATAAARAQLAIRTLERSRAEAQAAANVAAADIAAKQTTLNNLTATGLATAADLAAARNDLATAKANAETVRLAGERTQDEAAVNATDAGNDVTAKTAAVRAAELAVAHTADIVARRVAANELAMKERDLARGRAGVQIPADEVVFVATMPVRVSELLVGLGDLATGGILRATDAVVQVDGALAVEDAALVHPGMTVQIAEQDLGISTTGTVSQVAAAPGTNGVDGFHIYLTIAVAAPPPNLVGASVRLTIPITSTGGAVLAVPLGALTLAADGASRVQRNVGGAIEFVTVQPGLAADGYVAIGTSSSLRVGDLVVIGTNQTAAGPTGAGPTGAGPKTGGATTAVPTSVAGTATSRG
jgi:peptidoglycan hydrolase-like protein with peptidoglycan-binding domain